MLHLITYFICVYLFVAWYIENSAQNPNFKSFFVLFCFCNWHRWFQKCILFLLEGNCFVAILIISSNCRCTLIDSTNRKLIFILGWIPRYIQYTYDTCKYTIPLSITLNILTPNIHHEMRLWWFGCVYIYIF